MGRGISKGFYLMIPKGNVTNVGDEFANVVSVKGGWGVLKGSVWH